MSETPQEATREASPLQRGVDWVAKHWPRVRLAHEGMMLEKIGRQNRIVETVARNTMTGDMKNTDGWPAAGGEPGEAEGDPMGVNIGDHIHYHQADADAPASAAPDSSPSLLSRLLPYVVAIGAALGGYYLGQGSSAPPETTPQVTDKDEYGASWQHYVPNVDEATVP